MPRGRRGRSIGRGWKRWVGSAAQGLPMETGERAREDGGREKGREGKEGRREGEGRDGRTGGT